LPFNGGGVLNGDRKNSVAIRQATIVRWLPTKAFQKHMTCPPFVVTKCFSIDARLVIEKNLVFLVATGYDNQKISNCRKVRRLNFFSHHRIYGNPNGSSFGHP
jgi:hypothetical protein